ncbi:MAG: hypothetical protein GKR91_17455 [Pseudomonadales bacterium]|nr:hypothetical protein [Pseudomonadales bacterium]
MKFTHASKIIKLFLVLSSLSLINNSLFAQEVIVLSGPEDSIAWFESKQWWGETNREQQMAVPRSIITGTGPNWRTNAQGVTVAVKKELFYRFLTPLILHANDMVLDRRERLQAIEQQIDANERPSNDDLAFLGLTADVLHIVDDAEEVTEEVSFDALKIIVSEALYKLDVIPPGLALGQAAYESGYGTSRFANLGNALFGQWTFGGDGLVPEEQRGELGDHRIAAFDWPFDSVRSYFNNLNGHPAYDDFRRIRADLRQRGEPLDSQILADGLIRYSERGQEYVDTLKSIMRVNNLTVADNAEFSDEPLSFIVIANDEADKERVRQEIERMRSTGEIDEILKQMALE